MLVGVASPPKNQFQVHKYSARTQVVSGLIPIKFMSILSPKIQVLSEIYREHLWIDVDFSTLAPDVNRSELTRLCMLAVSQHLHKSLQLTIAPTFPSEESYFPTIAESIDGFALAISGAKVVFIPSQDLDLMGFEVEREWVDLRNWAADYYVPIQVDLVHDYLHLWGFISHQNLQQRATLDRDLQSYEVESADLIDNLETLWVSCELVANGELVPERGKMASLAALSEAEAKSSIERLQQRPASYSPRLLLPFDRWGAILDRPEYLSAYLNSTPVVTKIGNWFRSQLADLDKIGMNWADRGWKTIDQICDRSQPLPGYFAATNQSAKFAVRGVALNTDREIDRAVHNLYTNQSSLSTVVIPPDLESPVLRLVYLMQHTSDETLRWQAAEYLWTIAPEPSQNWHRLIKDLGLVMQGHKLGLMVAAIPLLDGKYAILNRVYPIGSEDYLPPDVQLDLLSETGDRLYRVESRASVMDSYIQLYFTASVGDRFNVCIAMNNASVTETFAI
jgi:hypothetical protein